MAAVISMIWCSGQFVYLGGGGGGRVAKNTGDTFLTRSSHTHTTQTKTYNPQTNHDVAFKPAMILEITLCKYSLAWMPRSAKRNSKHQQIGNYICTCTR